MDPRLRLLLALVLTAPGKSASPAEPAPPSPAYFRSDGGRAGVGNGRLPSDLGASNVLAWRVPLDSGHSTPILAANRLFLTAYNPTNHNLATLGLDPITGGTRWIQPAPVRRLEIYHPQVGNPATPTPATDGERVFAFFGSYGLLCYDLDGRLLWEQPLGPFQDEYGAGSSPVVADGRVILNQDHDTGSFVVAFDTRSGKVLWKTPRPEAVRSYATPVVWTGPGGKELLVAGALELAAYDPTTGERRWWTQGLARIVIPTPVVSEDTVYVASWAPGGDVGRRLTLSAWPVALSQWDQDHNGRLARTEIPDPEVLDRFFRMDLDQDGQLDQAEWDRHAAVFRRAQNGVLAVVPHGRGELPTSARRWHATRGAPYVSSPLLDRGLLWLVRDGGLVTSFDAADGSLLHDERLPAGGAYYASPVTGDGKVYFASQSGVVSVVANQRHWQLLSSHDFAEKIYATPLLADHALFIRTEKALYRFEEPTRPAP